MQVISVISSPSSFEKNGEMIKIRDVIKNASGILNYEVASHKDIKEALKYFAKVGVSAIIVLGDGALSSAIFEILLEDKPFGANIPPLVLLPGGENNVIAEAMGASCEVPHKQLKYILVKYEAGKILDHTVNIPVMKIEGVLGVDTLYGLSFAAGEITGEKIFFERKRISTSMAARFTDRILQQKTMRIAKIKSLGGKKLEKMIRVNRNGRGAVIGQFYMVLLSSLEEMLPHVKFPILGKKTGLNFLSVENNGEALSKAAGQIFKGAFDGKVKAGHVTEVIEHMRIALDGEFIVDGGRYAVNKQGELHISITARLKFIKLD